MLSFSHSSSRSALNTFEHFNMQTTRLLTAVWWESAWEPSAPLSSILQVTFLPFWIHKIDASCSLLEILVVWSVGNALSGGNNNGFNNGFNSGSFNACGKRRKRQVGKYLFLFQNLYLNSYSLAVSFFCVRPHLYLLFCLPVSIGLYCICFSRYFWGSGAFREPQQRTKKWNKQKFHDTL